MSSFEKNGCWFWNHWKTGHCIAGASNMRSSLSPDASTGGSPYPAMGLIDSPKNGLWSTWDGVTTKTISISYKLRPKVESGTKSLCQNAFCFGISTFIEILSCIKSIHVLPMWERSWRLSTGTHPHPTVPTSVPLLEKGEGLTLTKSPGPSLPKGRKLWPYHCHNMPFPLVNVYILLWKITIL